MDPTTEVIRGNRLNLDFRPLSKHLPRLAETYDALDAEQAAAALEQRQQTFKAPQAAVPFTAPSIANVAKLRSALKNVGTGTDYDNQLQLGTDTAQIRKDMRTGNPPATAVETPAPAAASAADEDAKRRSLFIRLAKTAQNEVLKPYLADYGLLSEMTLHKLRNKTLQQLEDLRKDVLMALSISNSPSVLRGILDSAVLMAEVASLKMYETTQITPLNGLHQLVMNDPEVKRTLELAALESDDYFMMNPKWNLLSRIVQLTREQYNRNDFVLKNQLKQLPADPDLMREFNDLDDINVDYNATAMQDNTVDMIVLEQPEQVVGDSDKT